MRADFCLGAFYGCQVHHFSSDPVGMYQHTPSGAPRLATPRCIQSIYVNTSGHHRMWVSVYVRKEMSGTDPVRLSRTDSFLLFNVHSTLDSHWCSTLSLVSFVCLLTTHPPDYLSLRAALKGVSVGFGVGYPILSSSTDCSVYREVRN